MCLGLTFCGRPDFLCLTPLHVGGLSLSSPSLLVVALLLSLFLVAACVLPFPFLVDFLLFSLSVSYSIPCPLNSK